MTAIESVLESLIEVDYRYEMERLQKAKKQDPLSKDELLRNTANILLQGSKLKALSSPLAPAKSRTLQSSVVQLHSNSTNTISIVPSTVELEGLTSLRLLCSRLQFIGNLKYQLWRIIYNVEHNTIESFEDSDDSAKIDADDEDDAANRRAVFERSLTKQLKSLPFVPLSAEISSWNDQTNVMDDSSALSTKSAKAGHPYSIQGLGLFLTKFQILYRSFMDVRLQFQESQDQNAIMKSASFLESLEDFAREFKITLDNTILSGSIGKQKIREPTGDKLDISILSFLNLPDWICSR